MSPSDPPPQNPYAPPEADAGLSSGPSSSWTRPPAGDLDAALRGELRLRLGPVLREAWAALSGNKLYLNLTIWASLLASTAISIGGLALVLAAEGKNFIQMIQSGQQQPAPTSPLLALIWTLFSTLPGAAFSLVMWGLALRRIEAGPRGPWAAAALHALPRLLALRLIETSPSLLALVPVRPELTMMQTLFVGALSTAVWVALVWTTPLVIDRGMGIFDAATTSMRLVPRTILPLIGLGIVWTLVYFLSSLACFIGFIWTLPWIILTLGAAWRQLAGLQGGVGVASGGAG